MDTRTHTDALDRFNRTFWQGLVLDLVIALILTLSTAFTDIAWTAAYWSALGLVAAKTLLQSAIAYFMRKLVAPKIERQDNA